jgi:hypothetical protein
MLLRLGVSTAARALSASTDLSSLPSICPTQIFTGHACPLCGITRAVGSLASGDLTAAVAYHPMAIVLSIQIAALGFLFARGSSLSDARWFGSESRGASTLVAANALMFLAIWIFRWRFNMLDAALGN